MDLKRYINILWRRKWVILLTVVFTMLVVIVGTYFQTPVYQASTTLRIATSAGSDLSYQDYQYADRLMNTYIEITTSEPVLAELMKRLNLNKPPSLKAEILPNTELIKITIEDKNPRLAAIAANTMADILIRQSNQLYTGGGISSTEVLGKQLAIAKDGLDKTQQKYQQLLIQTPPAPDEIAVAQQTLSLQQNTYANMLSQYEQASIRETIQANMITIIQPASVPISPSKPRVLINYALGLVISLVVGLGLGFLFEYYDTTLYSSDDIESITKLTTLAKIPKAKKNQVNISKNGTSLFAEAIRNLATKIQIIAHQQTRKVFLIVSPEPRQGKSLIVTNLAIALAESGKKVIAVDCDLHLPQLHHLFHLPNENGLTDVIEREAKLASCLQKSQYEGVTLLTSGPLPNYPSKVLDSPQMAELIDKLKQDYDYVLLDTPALLSIADTEILVNGVDDLILVVRRANTKRESVQMASKYLEEFNEKSIMLVINQADSNKDYGYYQYPRKPRINLTRKNQSLIERGLQTNQEPEQISS